MKVEYSKAKVWEIEWENHTITLEYLYSGEYIYRLYIDGKCLAKSRKYIGKSVLRAPIENQDEKRSIYCYFSNRLDWYKELKILRMRQGFWERVENFIYDEIIGLDTVVVHLEIDGQAIYNSLFGTKEDIEKINNILEKFYD